jgi:alcohol dehydrogenase class IV
MIVRWGLDSLPGVLEELSIGAPLLISTARWSEFKLPVRAKRFHGALPHADVTGVREAVAAAEGADGLIALGGGSAIDTSKAVSSQTGLAIVSIPTTYSGAEWTQGFGMRDREAGVKRGGGGAHTTAIIYEPALTLDLPPGESAGSAMNALAHCAEGLYARGRSEETDSAALAGAQLISEWLPVVVENGGDLEARGQLLAGAMHAGAALRAGMGVGHAMAQALGGRYGLAHGTMNAVCLPPALRYNRETVLEAIARLEEAMGAGDAIDRVSRLAELAGPPRLREYGVPREDLASLSEAAAERAPAKGNPRPAPPQAIQQLYEEIW